MINENLDNLTCILTPLKIINVNSYGSRKNYKNGIGIKTLLSKGKDKTTKKKKKKTKNYAIIIQ